MALILSSSSTPYIYSYPFGLYFYFCQHRRVTLDRIDKKKGKSYYEKGQYNGVFGVVERQCS